MVNTIRLIIAMFFLWMGLTVVFTGEYLFGYEPILFSQGPGADGAAWIAGASFFYIQVLIRAISGKEIYQT